MSREYPKRPILGVGAVVIEAGKVLLIKRGKEPSLGEWSLPGGRVKLGESIRDAIAREVIEETGLDIEIGDVVEILERIFRDNKRKIKYHYLLVDFFARPKGGILVASSDASDASFFSIEEIEGMNLPTVTEEVILKGLDIFNSDRKRSPQRTT